MSIKHSARGHLVLWAIVFLSSFLARFLIFALHFPGSVTTSHMVPEKSVAGSYRDKASLQCRYLAIDL